MGMLQLTSHKESHHTTKHLQSTEFPISDPNSPCFHNVIIVSLCRIIKHSSQYLSIIFLSWQNFWSNVCRSSNRWLRLRVQQSRLHFNVKLITEFTEKYMKKGSLWWDVTNLGESKVTNFKSRSWISVK